MVKNVIGGVVLAVMVAGCGMFGPSQVDFPVAQALVERVAGESEGLVRLTLHAVPAGGSDLQVVASTSEEKRGNWSDAEDLEVVATGQPVERMEGENFDLSQPVTADDGSVMAVIGVTVSGTGKPAMRMAAEAVAAKVAEAIHASETPMW